MSVIAGNKTATVRAIRKFREVEQLRLTLDKAEHELHVMLREDIDTGYYARQTALFGREMEAERERLQRQGRLP